MRLRTQNWIAATISLALVSVIAVTLLQASRNLSRAIERSSFSTTIVVAESQLRFLAVEYLQHHHERPRAQWLQRHQSIERLLASSAYERTAEQHILERMRAQHRGLRGIFASIVANHDARAGGARAPDLVEQLELRLAGQLMEASQTIMTEAARLADVSHHILAASQAESNLVIALAVAGMALIIIMNVAVTRIGVLRPIDRLTRSMTLVAQGDFQARTAMGARNEIGDLSRCFDYMASSVQAFGDELKKKAEQLAEANKELESFSYSVSHDLRAPLRAVDGFSQRLEQHCGKDLDPTALHYLQRIRAGTRTMGQLIEDLLNLSKISRTAVNFRSVDLSALAHRVIDELRTTEPSKAVEVVVQDGMVVWGDARLLDIALRNLLGNALKFTSATDRARIECGRVSEGNGFVYFVADNGAGFDMNYADKLFAPFQRLHSSSEFPGTGIGLVIVRRIIQRHGGHIWAEASIGHGARFSFTLPLEESRATHTVAGRR